MVYGCKFLHTYQHCIDINKFLLFRPQPMFSIKIPVLSDLLTFPNTPSKTLLLHVLVLCGQQRGLHLLVSMILIRQCKYDQFPELQSLYLVGEGRNPQLPHTPAASGKG